MVRELPKHPAENNRRDLLPSGPRPETLEPAAAREIDPIVSATSPVTNPQYRLQQAPPAKPAAVCGARAIHRYYVDLAQQEDAVMSEALVAAGLRALQPRMASNDKPSCESTLYQLVRARLIGLAHGASRLMHQQPQMNSSCAPMRAASMDDEQVVNALIAVHHYGGATSWVQTNTEPHAQPKYIQKYLEQTQAATVHMRVGSESVQWMTSRAGNTTQ